MTYIRRIQVENCRNIRHLDIDLSVEPSADLAEAPSAEKPARLFRNLILTGPNGSGKSGILEAVAEYFVFVHEWASQGKDAHATEVWKERLKLEWQPTFNFERPWQLVSWLRTHDIFFAYISSRRTIKTESVAGPSALALDLGMTRPKTELVGAFLQFLVNKHTEKAYAVADGDSIAVERIEAWFNNLWRHFRLLMEEPNLEIRYDRAAFTFRFRSQKSGYEFDLGTLADGHAAAFALIAEILLRIEAAQRARKDWTFAPAGVVLVDEIETHLHLSLQEQILPLLTDLFPTVQFIVATHSPAVIASVSGAVVYDLGKQKQIISDAYRGIPYGMLMTEHFGISSDIDLDSTQKLLRFRALASITSRSGDEEREMNELAAQLSSRSQVLATEVWMVKERLGASSIALAGE